MKHSELVALARISRQGPAGRLSVTIGGDGLRSLQTPFQAFLYEPTPRERGNQALLDPAQKGLDPEGILYPVQVTMASLSSGTGGVMLNPIPDIQSGIEGCWLCVERRLLEDPEDLFFFELREFEVVDADDGTPLGQVEDYQETAAHGVLSVRTPQGQEVLLPLVEQYVLIDRERRLVRVRQFDDFT